MEFLGLTDVNVDRIDSSYPVDRFYSFPTGLTAVSRFVVVIVLQ